VSRIPGWEPTEGWSPYFSGYVPELSVAAYRAGLPENDLKQINSWSKLYSKHRELLKMDNDAAFAEYQQLDESVQQALQSTFDNPDYLNKPKDWTVLGAIGSFAKTAVTSPFKGAFQALSGYSNLLTGVAGGTLGYAAQTGQFKASMLNFWADDWDGKRIWNVEYTKQLDEMYGPGMSSLAKGLVTGWTPGRVIEEAGGVTPEMERALNFMQENPDKFADILADYRRAQVSPGRELARKELRLSPDAPTIDEVAFDRLSGVYDATFQVIADPLTWATLGTWGAAKSIVRGVQTGAREGLLAKATLTEDLLPRKFIVNKGAVYGNLFKAGIAPEKAVPEVFKLPQVRQVWDGIPGKTPGLGPLLKQFREGDAVVRARVMTAISQNYPAYNNDEIVRVLALNGDKDKGTLIENADTAAQFFINAEHAKYLFSGKSNSMMFYRTNHVVTANKSSLWANTIRKTISDNFNSRLKGTTDKNLFEAIQEGDRVMDAAYFEGKYIEIGSDLNQAARKVADARNTDHLFKFASNLMQRWDQRLNRYLSRHPLGRPIFTNDDDVAQSLDAFRDLARVVLPNTEAKVLTQRFADLKEYDRIVLLRGLYADVLHSSGLGAIPGGSEIIQNILKTKFGAQGTYAVGNAIDIPRTLKTTQLARAGAELGAEIDSLKVQSPIQNFQFTSAIGQLDWIEIAKLKGDNAKVWNGLRRFGVILNGQAVSHATNAWSLLTLAPKLGVRATVDELFLFSLYAPKEVLYNYFRGAGRKAVKVLAVAQGKADGLSFTGEKFFKLQDTITNDMRIAIQDEAYKLFPNDFDAQKTYALTEFFRIALKELKNTPNLGDNLPAIDKLDNADIQSLFDFVQVNPLGFDSLSSQQARVAGVSGGVVAPVQDLVSKGAMETAMKELGVVNAGKWVELPASASKGQRVLGQYANASARFMDNYEKFGVKSTSPSEIFFVNNGIKTDQDFYNAVTDVLRNFGIKLPEGKTYLDVVEGVRTGLLTEPAEMFAKGTPARKLLDSLSEYSSLKGSASDLEILTRWTELHVLDLRKSFHGSSDLNIFNNGLFNYIKERTFIPVKQGKYKGFNWDSLQVEEYGKLVENNLIAGEMAVPFQAGPTNLTEWLAEYGNKIFEAMDQQVTSYYRAPAFMAFYLQRAKTLRDGGYKDQYRRELLDKFKEQYLSKGPKGVIPDEQVAKMEARAEQLATRAITEFAVQDTLNSIMKYADNPQVRTALAFNLRNGSRFYRATEDFVRRFYRLKDHSIKTIMRMRLSALGLSASGFVHEDAQGQSYVVMPMDDLIFQVVDKPLRVLTGGKAGYNQTLVGDFTLRLSQVNPSFGPDATTPTLSGPVASLSVLTAKSILGRLGPDGRYAADKIDNLLLGDIGDNLDLRRAIVPASVDRVWRILDANEKDRQEVSALHQVIAYNAAHGKGLPSDATPEEQYEYIKNLRISAHNVVVMRNLLGLLPIPFSPTLKETKDVPAFLKEVGVASIRQEFFDIYEGVLSNPNPRLDDPYEEALAIYVGKNPNKLIYTVSRSDKTTSVAFQKTEEVKDWYIRNKSLIDEYGEAAWLAAPTVGEFTPSSYAWFEASGLIDNKDLESYLQEVQVAVDRQNYFDIEDVAREQIAQTADMYQIQSIADSMNMAQEMILTSNPILKQRFMSGDFGVEKEKAILTNLSYMLADQKVNMNPATRDRLSKALTIMTETAYKINSETGQSTQLRRDIRDQAISDLRILADIDYTLRQANKAIFIPILKSLSRDTQVR
jgi:hypothetical protein